LAKPGRDGDKGKREREGKNSKGWEKNDILERGRSYKER